MFKSRSGCRTLSSREVTEFDSSTFCRGVGRFASLRRFFGTFLKCRAKLGAWYGRRVLGDWIFIEDANRKLFLLRFNAVNAWTMNIVRNLLKRRILCCIIGDPSSIRAPAVSNAFLHNCSNEQNKHECQHRSLTFSSFRKRPKNLFVRRSSQTLAERNTFSEPERKTKLVFNLRTDTVGAPPGRNTWEIHDPRVVISFLSTHQPKPENVLHVYVLLRQTKIPNIVSVDETSSTPLAKKGFPPIGTLCPCFV